MSYQVFTDPSSTYSRKLQKDLQWSNYPNPTKDVIVAVSNKEVNEFISQMEEMRRRNLIWGDQNCSRITSDEFCHDLKSVTKQCTVDNKIKALPKVCKDNYGNAIETFIGASGPTKAAFLVILAEKIHLFEIRLGWLQELANMPYQAESNEFRGLIEKLLQSHIRPADAIGVVHPTQVAHVMHMVNKKHKNPTYTKSKSIASELYLSNDAIKTQKMKLEMLRAEAQICLARNKELVKQFVRVVFLSHFNLTLTSIIPYKIDRKDELKLEKLHQESVLEAMDDILMQFNHNSYQIDEIINEGLEYVMTLPEDQIIRAYIIASKTLLEFDFNRPIHIGEGVMETFLGEKLAHKFHVFDLDSIFEYYRQNYPSKCYPIENLVQKKIKLDTSMIKDIVMSRNKRNTIDSKSENSLSSSVLSISPEATTKLAKNNSRSNSDFNIHSSSNKYYESDSDNVFDEPSFHYDNYPKNGNGNLL